MEYKLTIKSGERRYDCVLEVDNDMQAKREFRQIAASIRFMLGKAEGELFNPEGESIDSVK